MVGESDQNVFLIQIDSSSFAGFDIFEFELSRFDCNLIYVHVVVEALGTYFHALARALVTPTGFSAPPLAAQDTAVGIVHVAKWLTNIPSIC